jgi:hypothetical protein
VLISGVPSSSSSLPGTTSSLILDRPFHPHGVKQHVVVAARSRAAVDASHVAALKAGGGSIHVGQPASITTVLSIVPSCRKDQLGNFLRMGQ